MPDERLARLVGGRLRLLSDPLRIRLIFALRDGEMSVSALADALDRPHRAVSHHLGALYRDGVLDRRQEGPNVFYCLADFSACQVVILAGEGVNARIEELSELSGEQPTTRWFT